MDRRTIIALSGTAIYLMALITLVVCQLNEFLQLPLNSLGDFLAGAFGPLALGWVVFGYFQQGDELRNGTAALKIQGDELKNSVEQQQRLAEISIQTLELQKQEREEQQRIYRHGLLPIFHLENVEMRLEEGKYVGRCRLFNDGSQVYSIDVNFIQGFGWSQCAVFRTLDRGESQDFIIKWALDSPSEKFIVDVFYTMKDTVKGLARFKVIADKSNNAPLGKITFTREDIVLPKT